VGSIDDIRKRFSNPAPKLEPREEKRVTRSGLRDKPIRDDMAWLRDSDDDAFPDQYLCPVDGKGGSMVSGIEGLVGACSGSCGHQHETERFAKCRKCLLWVVPVEEGFKRQWYCPKCRDVLLSAMDLVTWPGHPRGAMAELVDAAFKARMERDDIDPDERVEGVPPPEPPEIDITSEEGIRKAVDAGAVKEFRCVHCGSGEFSHPDLGGTTCCGVPMAEVR
jgi:hypothetical protein